MSSNENSAPITAATQHKAFKDTINPFGQVGRGSSSSVGFELIPKRKPIKPRGTNAEPATLHKIAPKSALNQRGVSGNNLVTIETKLITPKYITP